MDKKTAIVLSGVVVAFLAAMGIAAQFGGAGTSAKNSGASSRATVKLRAKAGTQRENARAIVGSTPSVPSENQPRKGGVPSEKAEVWGHISKSREELAKSLGERLAREAMTSLSTNEGIERIREELESAKNMKGTSHLYSAMGQLQSRIVPLDLDVVQEAFASAIEAASSPEERVAAIYYQTRTLMELGQTDLALNSAEKLPEDTGTAVQLVSEVEIMAGRAYQEKGDPAKAIEAFDSARYRAESMEGVPSDALKNVYRQAALCLSRLYIEQGDDEKAKRVAEDMQYWLER